MSAYRLYRLAEWMYATLPSGVCLRLAERLADVQWRFSSVDRAAVRANLATVLGHPVAEDSPVVREVFRNFGRYLVEFFNAHRHQGSAVTIEGTEQIVERVAPNQGWIILSAHLGNWELGAMALSRLGCRVSVVALPHRDPRTNQLFDASRLRGGVQVVPRGLGATQRCLDLLRKGWALGIAGDREFGSNGITVSFFGRPATLPRGPALLSLRTGAPAVPVFLIREGLWRFRFHVEPPIWPDGPQTHASVLALTQRYAHVIERAIRRCPSQWLMFQPIFGKPPAGSANCELSIADLQGEPIRNSQSEIRN